jgi:thiosulfate dehydrogenase
VRQGQAIFMNTKALAPQYVGNEMACVNCHLDRGRKANSAPLWAAYTMYPAYRKKNNKVNSFAERMQGCFQFSMNGKAPAADSEVLNALTAYAYWLSTGAPVGAGPAGPRLRRADAAQGRLRHRPRGEGLQAQCALCHGANGEGKKVGRPRSSRRCGARTPTTGAPACTASTRRPASSSTTCRWARARR